MDWRERSFDLGPISHREILAWATLFRIDISPTEVDVLRKLDREFRHWFAHKDDEPQLSIGEQMARLKAEHDAKKKAQNGR